MRKAPRTTAVEIETVSPPVPAVEALRRNLLHRFLKRVGEKEGSVEKVADSLIEKAESGDTKAQALYLSFLNAGAEREPSRQTIQQSVTVNHINAVQDLRRTIVHIIAHDGPKKPAEVAGLLGVSLERAIEAMEFSPWFDKESDGWHLTNKAHAEVIRTKEGETDEA